MAAAEAGDNGRAGSSKVGRFMALDTSDRIRAQSSCNENPTISLLAGAEFGF